MELKRFSGFDVTYDPKEYDRDDQDKELDVLNNKEYLDFLKKDGKSIRIRKIDTVADEIILVYYDNIPQSPEKEQAPFNRFAEIDI